MSTDVHKILEHKKLEDVIGDDSLRAHIEDILAADGYELVIPPNEFKEGDEFLNAGTRWRRVTEKSHPPDVNGRRYNNNSMYIIRRKNEKQKMIDFFFKSRRQDIE